jgi:hypothetical protein
VAGHAVLQVGLTPLAAAMAWGEQQAVEQLEACLRGLRSTIRPELDPKVFSLLDEQLFVTLDQVGAGGLVPLGHENMYSSRSLLDAISRLGVIGYAADTSRFVLVSLKIASHLES